MSIEYVSAIIYGYDLSDQLNDDSEVIDEFITALENADFNVIYDGYSGEFLYVGILVSKCDIWDQKRISITTQLSVAHAEVNRLLAQAPLEIISKLPLREVPMTFHLCYAE